ncbi:MAG: hypothetical protein DMG12_23635 [Acidobacteria bacterium]|nr:MAG: hypothetical protein DMG12_23635 [Acidobacteriota bacterium]
MLRDFVCVAVLMFLPVVSVFGQGAVAEFNGSAADQSGALLPGVAVTLTEETTGLMRTTASNESGRCYRIYRYSALAADDADAYLHDLGV